MTKYITQVKNPADANDPYIIKDPNAEIAVGQMVGKMYRSNVGGSGSFSISGNSGIIPNLTAGTYTVHIYARSATPSYTFRFNFGTSVTYDLSATDGILSDTRTITISDGTFSGSVVAPSGGVASGTHLYVVMYNASTTIPIKGVGAAAVTNSYSDLNDKPTIPAAANNGTLTLKGQYSGTSGSTADSSGNSLFTANASSGSTLTITGTATDSGIKTYRNGNNVYIQHTNSVTAASNVGTNTTTSLINGGTFVVPYLSYDANGHITASGTNTLTLPSNTDEKVKQTASTSNSKHPLLASSVISTVIGTGTTDESIYCEGINIEPSINTISIETGDSTYSALSELSSGDIKTYLNVSGNTFYSSELNPAELKIDNDADKFYINASGQYATFTVQSKNANDDVEYETYASPGYLETTLYDVNGADPTMASSITVVGYDGVSTPALTITSLGTTSPQMLVVGTDGTVSSQAIPSNTDEKVTDVAGTGKAYLLGHGTQGTNATAISNANVYMQNGRLTTSNLSITSLGTSTPKMLVVGTSGTVSSQAIPSDNLQQINSGKKIMVITGVNAESWTAGDAMTGQATSDLTYNFDDKILSSPALQLTNVQSGTPVSGGYLALDSGNNVIKTAGGGGSSALSIYGTAADFNSTSATTRSVAGNTYYTNCTISVNTGAVSFSGLNTGEMCYILVTNSNSSNAYNLSINSSYTGGGVYKIPALTKIEFSILYTGSTYIITYTTIKS